MMTSFILMSAFAFAADPDLQEVGTESAGNQADAEVVHVPFYVGITPHIERGEIDREIVHHFDLSLGVTGADRLEGAQFSLAGNIIKEDASGFQGTVGINKADSVRGVQSAVGANIAGEVKGAQLGVCLLYTSPSPRDRTRSRMPSSA